MEWSPSCVAKPIPASGSTTSAIAYCVFRDQCIKPLSRSVQYQILVSRCSKTHGMSSVWVSTKTPGGVGGHRTVAQWDDRGTDRVSGDAAGSDGGRWYHSSPAGCCTVSRCRWLPRTVCIDRIQYLIVSIQLFFLPSLQLKTRHIHTFVCPKRQTLSYHQNLRKQNNEQLGLK